MRRAMWASVGLIILAGALRSPASAVERQLATVHLGDNALALLSKAGYGQPDYIGPLGTIAIPAPEEAAGAAGTRRAAGATAVARRSGPAGPRAGGRADEMGMRGAMSDRGGRGGAGARTPSAGRAATQGPGMLWYYRRPLGNVMVLSLDPRGNITQITLRGTAPYTGGRTSKDIGLTSTYMNIVARYGYPDQSSVQDGTIELIYIDHGVRFRLDAMRVTEIAIGAPVTAGIPVAPVVTPAVPPAGMTVEELRGYL
jgi:hypothetical protein